MLWEHQPTVVPRKFDVLNKANNCPRSEALPEYIYNMLVLRTSYFQRAIMRPLVPRHKHSIVFIVHHFLPRAGSKIISNYFQLMMKVVTAKCKILKRKHSKTHLIQFQLFIFDMPACLQQNIHGRVLSIRVFSADEHYRVMSSI